MYVAPPLLPASARSSISSLFKLLAGRGGLRGSAGAGVGRGASAVVMVCGTVVVRVVVGSIAVRIYHVGEFNACLQESGTLDASHSQW